MLARRYPQDEAVGAILETGPHPEDGAEGRPGNPVSQAGDFKNRLSRADGSQPSSTTSRRLSF